MVIVRNGFPQPCQNAFHPRRLRGRFPTDVQEVDQPPQGVGDRGLQSKAPDQNFEGHPRADVAERRPVKIKTDRRRRTILRRGKPQEPRLRVDKALNQPGAGQTIDPRPSAGGPQTAAKGLSVQQAQFARNRLRLVRRQPLINRLLEGGQSLSGLLPGGPREEINSLDPPVVTLNFTQLFELSRQSVGG